MQVPEDWVEIISGKRYSVADSVCVCDDAYWDGRNWERRGRNTYLYRTKKGNYFRITLTQWQGERDAITPITQDEALNLWDALPEKHEIFEDAFPGVTVEDA